MYPHERSLVERLKNAKFTLLGINSEDTPQAARAAFEREKTTWPVIFDGGSTQGPVATKWGVRGWPTTYVLDAKGIIRYTDVRDEEMDAAVNALLVEQAKEE
jgi:peroxiredoxin